MFQITKFTLSDRIYPIERTYMRIEDLLRPRQILRAFKVRAIWLGKEPCAFQWYRQQNGERRVIHRIIKKVYIPPRGPQSVPNARVRMSNNSNNTVWKKTKHTEKSLYWLSLILSSFFLLYSRFHDGVETLWYFIYLRQQKVEFRQNFYICICKNEEPFLCRFLRSADKVGRPFCCCIVFSLLFFIIFFLFH